LGDRKDMWPIKKPVSLTPRSFVKEQLEEEDPMGNRLTQVHRKIWK